jgi:hypothetical protein
MYSCRARIMLELWADLTVADKSSEFTKAVSKKVYPLLGKHLAVFTSGALSAILDFHRLLSCANR